MGVAAVTWVQLLSRQLLRPLYAKKPSDWCRALSPPPPPSKKTASLYPHLLWKLSQLQPAVYALRHGNRGLHELSSGEIGEGSGEREKEDGASEERATWLGRDGMSKRVVSTAE